MEELKKLGTKYYPGSSVGGKSYQDLSFLGYDKPSHRKGTKDRAAFINSHFNVNGKKGLDIGCSVGALSMALAKIHGASMVGVDIDENSVNAGNAIAQKHGIDASFKCQDITSRSFKLSTLNKSSNYDFAIWFSNFMWIAKYHEFDTAFKLLNYVSQKVDVLFFETSQGPKDGVAGSHSLDGAKGVRDALQEHTEYTHIVDLGVPTGQRWAKRNVFLASR